MTTPFQTNIQNTQAAMDEIGNLLKVAPNKSKNTEEALIAALQKLVGHITALQQTNPEPSEKPLLISLQADLDTLFQKAEKADTNLRNQLKTLNKSLQAQKSYKQTGSNK